MDGIEQFKKFKDEIKKVKEKSLDISYRLNARDQVQLHYRTMELLEYLKDNLILDDEHYQFITDFVEEEMIDNDTFKKFLNFGLRLFYTKYEPLKVIINS